MPPDLYAAASGPGQGLAQVFDFNPSMWMGFEQDIMARQLAADEVRRKADAERQRLIREGRSAFQTQYQSIAPIETIASQMERANAPIRQAVQMGNDILNTEAGRLAVDAFAVGNPTPEQRALLAPYQQLLRDIEFNRKREEALRKQYEEANAGVLAGTHVAAPTVAAFEQGVDPRAMDYVIDPSTKIQDLQARIQRANQILEQTVAKLKNEYRGADWESSTESQVATEAERRRLAREIISDPLMASSMDATPEYAGLTPQQREDRIMQMINRNVQTRESGLGAEREAEARARGAARGTQEAEAVINIGRINLEPDPLFGRETGTQPQTTVAGQPVTRQQQTPSIMGVGGNMFTTGRRQTYTAGAQPAISTGVTAFATGAPEDAQTSRRLIPFDLSRGSWNVTQGASFDGDNSQMGFPGELRVVPVVDGPNGQRILLNDQTHAEAIETGTLNGRPVRYEVMQSVQIPQGEVRTTTTTDANGQEVRTATETPQSTFTVLTEPQYLQGVYNPRTIEALNNEAQRLTQQYSRSRGGAQTPATAPATQGTAPAAPGTTQQNQTAFRRRGLSYVPNVTP